MTILLEDILSDTNFKELLRDSSAQSLSELFSDDKPISILTKNKVYLGSLAFFKNCIGLNGIEGYTKKKADLGNWEQCFLSWKSLFALYENNNKERLKLIDFLRYCASGLAADRPTDVRNSTQKIDVYDLFGQSIDEVEDQWDTQLYRSISCAIISLISQKNSADLKRSRELIKELSHLQKEIEPHWLAQIDGDQRKIVKVAGFYHLAQAVLRLSEYLVSGFVKDESKNKLPFEQELKRLLIKAERFFEASGDLELIEWFSCSAICIYELFRNSLWRLMYGISDVFDEFISYLASDNNEHQFFSLLPSQREAINNSLLDPQKIAVVLQMPTSAGKTLLAEFSIVQALEAFGRDSRILYLTPTRALATQAKHSLSADFRHLGVSVTQASSAFEEDPLELELLQEQSGVIISTPEKADLLLRRDRKWFSEIKLVVIDEAHMLNEGDRGARLELLLANIRREVQDIRLLLLTPFVANAKILSDWLGGDRGVPINIAWRPTTSLVGIVEKKPVINEEGKQVRGQVGLDVLWRIPHSSEKDFEFESTLIKAIPSAETKSARALVNTCAKKLSNVGATLAMFPTSLVEAEKAAYEIALGRPYLSDNKISDELAFAIALAENDFGDDCQLAECLRKGVAYHHSSLSPELRFLIEDQIKNKVINYVAATTTLAQGMNFPVSSVIVHSTHKPYGGGDLTHGEFWNIAGRAGRVGLSDKGLVVFANPKHKDKWEYYTKTLDTPIVSSLLDLASYLGTEELNLKQLYKDVPKIRPFLQYFAHSMAVLGSTKAKEITFELINSSLMYQQLDDLTAIRKIRDLSSTYVDMLAEKNSGYLKLADSTGLGSFSFDELVGKVLQSDLLMSGPDAVLQSNTAGIKELIEAFRWIPEFNLSVDDEKAGSLNTDAIAHIVQGWIEGASIKELAKYHPNAKKDEHKKINSVGKYIYSTVSQSISWGVHAYSKALALNTNEDSDKLTNMLPSYIQYGVNSPEASVASLLGVPRVFAQAISQQFINKHGNVTKENVKTFKAFVESHNGTEWDNVVKSSRIYSKVSASQAVSVVKKLQGI